MVFVECKSPMERTAHPDRTRSMVESTSFVVKKKKSDQFPVCHCGLERVSCGGPEAGSG